MKETAVQLICTVYMQRERRCSKTPLISLAMSVVNEYSL